MQGKMRLLILLFGALQTGCGAAPVDRELAAPIGPDLIAHPVPGVRAWRIEHVKPISANALVVLMADGTPVLTDTPWTPAATRQLLNWVETRFGQPPALATIGHFHLDASGGLGVLQEAGIKVIVSAHTARLMAARGEGMRKHMVKSHGAAFDGWTVPVAQNALPVATRRRLVVGGEPIEVIFPGHGHAPDNTVVWFPHQKLLFGGCLIKGGKSIGYLGDANLPTYADAVRSLLPLGAKTVVGGHGPRTDPGQLKHTIDLAEAAKNKAANTASAP